MPSCRRAAVRLVPLYSDVRQHRPTLTNECDWAVIVRDVLGDDGNDMFSLRGRLIFF